MILDRYFNLKMEGFYVDIGAHHPQRFSNTYKFYKRGWKGINVDAMPRSMEEFNKKRKRDINIEVPVSAESAVLPYYIFNEPALNSFDEKISKQRDQDESSFSIVRIEHIKTRRLSEILDEYLPRGQQIDFLNIDVEGFDLEVLKSNDWQKYRPEVVLVEILGNSLVEVIESDINHFMNSLDYELYAKSVNTVFYTNGLG